MSMLRVSTVMILVLGKGGLISASNMKSLLTKSYTEGSTVNIVATPASGYAFDKWSDGNTQASRTVTMDADKTLVASFKVAQTQGSEDDTVGEY